MEPPQKSDAVRQKASDSLQSPPAFWEIYNTVEDYLTKCTHFEGWKVDTWEYGAPDKINLFPFAANNRVGAHASYENSEHKLRASMTATYPHGSWWSFVPSLRYRTQCGNSAHKIRLEEGGQTAKYSFRNPAFYASARTYLFDKMYTDMSATARVFEKAFLGCAMSYDPTRSGLKELTVMAVRQECPIFAKGDLAMKYTLRDGLSAQLRVPIHRMMDFAVIGEANRYIVGIHGRSPCGARMILNGNVSDGTATLSATRQIYGTWKIAAAATVPVVKTGERPRFGIQLIHQDVWVH